MAAKMAAKGVSGNGIIIDMTSGVVAELDKNNILRVVGKFGMVSLPDGFVSQPAHSLIMTAALRHPNMRDIIRDLADQLSFANGSLDLLTATFRTTNK